MINLQELYEWRWVDCASGASNGLVLPYYTQDCLKWLMEQHLSGKRVFEFGVGSSTAWYHAKGVECFGVESNPEWYEAVTSVVNDKSRIDLCTIPQFYANAIRQWKKEFDYIIVDGIERDACVPIAIEWLKPGGILIIDNWCQPSAYMPSQSVRDTVTKMKHIIYHQQGHPDWQTLVAWKD